MQEHEYKARDKTVQKMSRDGLREENLRNKEEKRITGRDMDTEVSRSEKKDELDFSKRRREHINEKRETEHPEQSSKKTRYSRESVLDEKSEQDIDGELDRKQVADESTAATKSAFRSESIRGQPRGERDYLETVADSRDLRKKKMVRDYALKEYGTAQRTGHPPHGGGHWPGQHRHADHADALERGRFRQRLPLHPLPELRLHGAGVLPQQAGPRPPRPESAGLGLGAAHLRFHGLHQAAFYYRCGVWACAGGRVGTGTVPEVQKRNVKTVQLFPAFLLTKRFRPGTIEKTD